MEVMEKTVKLKVYDSYRDSGVKWLGEVPEHWEVTKYKYISSIFNGDSLNESFKKKFESYDLEHLAYISTKEINVNDSSINYLNGIRIPRELQKYKIAPKNSSLLCIEGGSAGRKIAFTNQDTYFVNKLACFKVKGNHLSKFLYYTLKSDCFQTQFKLAMSGIIGGVAISNIHNFFLAIPSREEQITLTQYLDNKISSLDQAIGIKEKQIELLNERKQLLIHNIITKGLNSEVKFKNTEFEWIGSIPEHWEVKRAKYLFEEIDERSKTGDEELLSVSHMTGVTPRSEKNVSMFQSEDYTGSKLCQKNDLVFNIMWAWMGALGISDRTGIVSPSYAIYRQKKSEIFNSWYLEHLLRGTNYVAYYNRLSTGLHSSRLRFYSRMFFDMKIGFPPKEEQDEIVDFLKKSTHKITNIIAIKEKEIDKLKEYKLNLIDSVVTGKVKVL